jgi:Ras-related protein Rab-21
MWLEMAHRECGSNIVVYIAGNKNDLEEQRAIGFDDALALGAKLKISNVVECSAKTGAGVDDLFELIAANQDVSFGRVTVLGPATTKPRLCRI